MREQEPVSVWRWQHRATTGGTNFALALYRGVNAEADRTRAFHQIAEDGNRMLGTAENRKLQAALLTRRQDALRAAVRGRGEEIAEAPLMVEWRLIVGTSCGKALNVGMQVHPLYGVPYIPASALKGATAHWSHLAGYDKSEKETFGTVFGTQKRAGRVTFYDAYCEARQEKGGSGEEAVAEPYFVEDVLAPHYRGWYESGDAPGEWEEPEPIKFLAVRKGVRVKVTLSSGDSAVLERAMEWVRECVAWYGVGAKTRKNYGRLRPE